MEGKYSGKLERDTGGEGVIRSLVERWEGLEYAASQTGKKIGELVQRDIDRIDDEEDMLVQTARRIFAHEMALNLGRDVEKKAELLSIFQISAEKHIMDQKNMEFVNVLNGFERLFRIQTKEKKQMNVDVEKKKKESKRKEAEEKKKEKSNIVCLKSLQEQASSYVTTARKMNDQLQEMKEELNNLCSNCK